MVQWVIQRSMTRKKLMSWRHLQFSWLGLEYWLSDRNRLYTKVPCTDFICSAGREKTSISLKLDTGDCVHLSSPPKRGRQIKKCLPITWLLSHLLNCLQALLWIQPPSTQDQWELALTSQMNYKNKISLSKKIWN